LAVAAEFPCFEEFREIPRKHGNSAATVKFRGSARNSEKMWALFISFLSYLSTDGKLQNLAVDFRPYGRKIVLYAYEVPRRNHLSYSMFEKRLLLKANRC